MEDEIRAAPVVIGRLPGVVQAFDEVFVGKHRVQEILSETTLDLRSAGQCLGKAVRLVPDVGGLLGHLPDSLLQLRCTLRPLPQGFVKQTLDLKVRPSALGSYFKEKRYSVWG